MFWAEDVGGELLFGPIRARGEADNQNAAKHDNIIEDPTRVGGDHPAGLYLVTQIVPFTPASPTYGPAFVRLDPLGGEALEAKLNGRTGIGIHGGDLGVNESLRATYGCLRLDNDAVEELLALVAKELTARREVLYECEIVGQEGD